MVLKHGATVIPWRFGQDHDSNTMVVFAVPWSACKYHSMRIWQPYSIMYHGITV